MASRYPSLPPSAKGASSNFSCFIMSPSVWYLLQIDMKEVADLRIFNFRTEATMITDENCWQPFLCPCISCAQMPSRKPRRTERISAPMSSSSRDYSSRKASCWCNSDGKVAINIVLHMIFDPMPLHFTVILRS